MVIHEGICVTKVTPGAAMVALEFELRFRMRFSRTENREPKTQS